MLLILLVLLVALLPTLLCTGPARAIIVRQINDRLNGKLEIGELSLGWLSSVRLTGLKVTDDSGRQILQLNSLTTGITLLDLARQNFRFGKIAIDGLDFNGRREADGSTNFAKLIKSNSAPEKQTRQPKSDAGTKAEPSKLPDLQAELVLQNSRGTFEDVPAQRTVQFTSLKADINIPNINEPIANSLEAVCSLAGQPPGTIACSGNLLFVKNNQLLTGTQIKDAAVDEKLNVSGFDLGSLSPLLGKSSGIDTLAGQTNGEFAVQMQSGQDATLRGLLRITSLAVGGRALKGDIYRSPAIVLTVPATSVALQDGVPGRIRIGDGTDAQALTLEFAQGKLILAVDATASSLSNVAAKRPPGAAGHVHLGLNANAGELANALPQTFKLVEGVRLDSGTLKNDTQIDLAADKADLRQSLLLSDVTGTNSRTKTKISLQPIDLSAHAASLGGGGAIPDLRDITLAFKSGFATADVTAKDLGSLRAQIQGTLEKAQGELGQIIDFGDAKLAGAFDVAVDSSGDLIGAGGGARNATVKTVATLKGVQISGMKNSPEVKLSSATLSHSAVLERGKTQFISAVRDLNVDTDLASLSLDKSGVSALSGYNLKMHAAGSFNPDAPGTKVSLTALDVSDNQGLISVARKGDAPITLVILPDGSLHPSGMLALGADLKQVNTVLLGLSSTPVQATAKTAQGSELRSGRLSGDIDLSDAGGKQFQVAGNLAVSNLTVSSGGADALQNEQVTVVLKAVAQSDLSAVTVPALDATGTLFAAHVNELAMKLKTGAGADAKPVGLLDMIQKGTVRIDAPSLAKLQALASAFSPPAAPAAAAGASPKAAVAPAPPLEVASGAASVTLVLSNDGRHLLITPTASGKGIAIKKGAGADNVGDVEFAAAIAVTPKPAAPPAGAAPTTSPSLMDQIAELQVSKFELRGLGSQISLSEPLTITDLSGFLASLSNKAGAGGGGANQPGLRAAVHGAGPVADIMNLVQALQGAAPTAVYTGSYAFDQQVSLAGPATLAKGEANVKDFSVKSGANEFAEPSIRVVNDMSLDAESASINALSISMQSTKALDVTIKGKVTDLQKTRTMQGVTADLTYDAAALWKMVYPMLSPQTQTSVKEFKTAGTFTKHFELSGSYPASVKFNEAIRTLTARGGIALGLLDGKGLTVQNLDVPFVLADGKLRLAYAGKPAGQDLPPAAIANGGALTLGGLWVDLTQEHMQLNAPPKFQIMSRVNLTPALAANLGNWFANPLFAGANNATGLLDVTLARCDKLPLDSSVTTPSPDNQGQAEIDYSIKQLTLGNDTIVKLLGAMNRENTARSLQGDVRNAKIIISNGVITHDMTMDLGEHKRPLQLGGTVAMQDQAMQLTLTMPLSLLGLDRDKTVQQLGLQSIAVPLGGTVTHPTFDIGAAFQKNLIQQGPASILGNLLNKPKGGSAEPPPGPPAPGPPAGDNNPPPPSVNPPSVNPPSDNPLGGIGDLLGGLEKKKEKDKDKHKDKGKKPATKPSPRSPGASAGNAPPGDAPRCLVAAISSC